MREKKANVKKKLNKCLTCCMHQKCDMSRCFRKNCQGPFKNKDDFLTVAYKIIDMSIYERCSNEKL